jgi:hypothetical protein
VRLYVSSLEEGVVNEIEKVKKAEALKRYFGTEVRPVTTPELRDFLKTYGREVFDEFAQFAASEVGVELA